MKYKACQKCADSVGAVNVIGNIMMILIKGYMGVVGRSTGLIADAIHSSADLLATIIMIIGLRISDRDEDEDYPYGYGKAEYIVAIIIYFFLFAVGTYIVYHGARAIIMGYQIRPCLSAAWGAIFSIAINELMFRQSVCAGTQINSPSMVAKAWESRSDVYSSIAVLVGIVGAKMGFHFMDPLAAIMVGFIILKICVEMVVESSSQLMDRIPEEEDMDDVRKVLSKLKGIGEIKDIIGREIGRILEFEIALYVPAEITVAEGEEIKAKARNAIMNSTSRKTNVKVKLYANNLV
uniref:Magnetosome protein MamB n=1 Tax=Candidatus Magnetananas rongchengensis TaxID=1463558 RepID=A0A3S6J254_9BACT|nr:magnetosome protein MamB [Candidatus Magnetananas rongchenensis]